ncbi:serine/threonine-protein kinase [Acrocarpospora catenulata]|uniref:serine/threonine-protein kinase n=1 Tax=Acrocarpospora catenulata TaxID=2836182 RepID=UPI001BDB23C6|nr:serine/threonine-protein kinase [Acrocarpospora catenulata]
MGGRLGRVGPYALLERLGRGGMGEVYLAATRRGQQVALKMLRDPIEDDAEARLRLDREIRALRRVESPYVAQVLDADLSGDRPYLVMEHIKGENMLDAVRRRGPLAEPELIGVAQGLATALAIIHAAGVVHRDLKPANVLLGEDGPVLIDFGIAQVLDATRLTRTGTFLGTPGYAAPELFADEVVGEPADVHAWAATVAFAATGRPTFGRGTVESQVYAIMHGQADLKGVPAALLPLIRAALNREPAKRPTAALLADRLARLARATAAASDAGTGARTPSEDPPEKPEKRRFLGRKAQAAGDSEDAKKVLRNPASTERPRSAAARAERPERSERERTDRPERERPERPERERAERSERAERKAAAGRTAEEESVLAVEAAGGMPTGSAALVVLATLAVPCVIVSVVYPLATFAITGVLVVLARALWSGHWLVRRRRSARVRGVLRALSFPLTFAGSLIAALAWPGIPAGVAAFAALWLTSGGRLEPDWWNQPVPVTVAGVVFGVVCGGIIGREVERVGAELPELRREGLRALAVLGGFVALCAAAVRAISVFV